MNQSPNFFNVKVLATICSLLSASVVALPSYQSYGYQSHAYSSHQSAPASRGISYSYGLPGGGHVRFNMGGYRYSRPGQGQGQGGPSGAYGPQQPQEVAPGAANPSYTVDAQGSPQKEQKPNATEQDSENEVASPPAQDGEYGQGSGEGNVDTQSQPQAEGSTSQTEEGDCVEGGDQGASGSEETDGGQDQAPEYGPEVNDDENEVDGSPAQEQGEANPQDQTGNDGSGDISQQQGSEPAEPQQNGNEQGYPQQQGGDQGYPQQQGGDQGYPQQQGGDQGYPQQQGGDQGYPQQQKPNYETEDNEVSTNTTGGSGTTGEFNIKAMLDLVNKERENAPTKAPALTLNDKLTQAAQLQSDHQKSTGQMSHDGPKGLESLSLRVKKFQYSFGAIAENVADGEMTVEDVMYCWMQSPCHRANLLNPAYKEFGAALSGKFCTQVLGTSGYLTEEQQTNPNQGSCDPNNHTPHQCDLKARGPTKYY